MVKAALHHIAVYFQVLVTLSSRAVVTSGVEIYQ